MVRTPVIASLVLGALVACPAAAQDKATLVLQPSSQWQLDMGEHRCRLARTFGTGASETLFYIEQFNPSARFSYGVAGPSLNDLRITDKFQRLPERKVEVQFGPALPGYEQSYEDASLGDLGAAIMGYGPVQTVFETKEEFEGRATKNPEPAGGSRELRELDAETGKAISWLSLSSPRIGTVKLELGGMEAPFKAMNFCMDDLVKTWGLDPEQQKQIQKFPVWLNDKKIVRSIQRNYPAQALRGGRMARFNIRVIVDEEGRAESCQLTNMTTSEGFDRDLTVCGLIKNGAKFSPALAASGSPVRSFFTSSVRYVIPS